MAKDGNDNKANGNVYLNTIGVGLLTYEQKSFSRFARTKCSIGNFLGAKEFFWVGRSQFSECSCRLTYIRIFGVTLLYECKIRELFDLSMKL